MPGYTRQQAAAMADGNLISAGIFNSEFDAIHAAFNGTSGHNHDGEDGEGSRVTVLGPAGDFVATPTGFNPKSDGLYSFGLTNLRWSTGWFTGPITVGTPTAVGHAATKKYVDDAAASVTAATATNYLNKTATGTQTMVATLAAPRFAVDGTFYLTLGSSTPTAVVNYDAQDYDTFSRDTNTFRKIIGATTRFTISETDAQFTVPLVVQAPTANNHATRKDYVDAAVTNVDNKIVGPNGIHARLATNDVNIGNLGNAAASHNATLVNYGSRIVTAEANIGNLSNAVGNRLPFSGGSMTGPLAVQGRTFSQEGSYIVTRYSGDGWLDAWSNATGERTWSNPQGGLMTLNSTGNLWTKGLVNAENVISRGDITFPSNRVLYAGSQRIFEDASSSYHSYTTDGWNNVWNKANGGRHWTSPQATQMTLDFGGNLFTIGSVNGSDERIKEVADPITLDAALDFISLIPRTYRMKNQFMDGSSGPLKFGFIAQDIASKPSLAPLVGTQPRPGLVADAERGSPADNLLTLDSGLAAPALLAVALKHALDRIAALEAKNAE